MGSPELIRQIADFRREKREAMERKKLLQQRDLWKVSQEVAKTQAEQTETNEMFRKMRTDCEDLLNSRGVIKGTRFLDEGLSYLWIKRKVLETSIADEEGEEVKVVLFSSKIEPASSEIRLVVGTLGFSHTESDSFLSLRRDKSYILSPVPASTYKQKRTPNLEDARNWKEVVDVLKNQTNQISPIEHK